MTCLPCARVSRGSGRAVPSARRYHPAGHRVVSSSVVTIATWNVNSIRTRLPRLLAWLERRRPDVVCLQETKVADDQFPFAELAGLGYTALAAGQQTYNGVAVLARAGAEAIARRLPDEGEDAQRRLLVARVAGLTVLSVYGPNGPEGGSGKYAYKLDRDRRFRALLEGSAQPHEARVLCGDRERTPLNSRHPVISYAGLC